MNRLPHGLQFHPNVDNVAYYREHHAVFMSIPASPAPHDLEALNSPINALYLDSLRCDAAVVDVLIECESWNIGKWSLVKHLGF